LPWEFVDPSNQGTDMKTRLGASLGAAETVVGANPEVKASDDPVIGVPGVLKLVINGI